MGRDNIIFASPFHEKIPQNVNTVYAAICYDDGDFELVFLPHPFSLQNRPEYSRFDPIDYYTVESALDIEDLRVGNGSLFHSSRALRRFVLQAGIMENPYNDQLEFTLCSECNGLHNEDICPYCKHTD